MSKILYFNCKVALHVIITNPIQLIFHSAVLFVQEAEPGAVAVFRMRMGGVGEVGHLHIGLSVLFSNGRTVKIHTTKPQSSTPSYCLIWLDQDHEVYTEVWLSLVAGNIKQRVSRFYGALCFTSNSLNYSVL